MRNAAVTGTLGRRWTLSVCTWATAADEARLEVSKSTQWNQLIIGLVIGLEIYRAEQPPTPKWLNRRKIKMVGAIGFEPMTSTV